MWVQIEFFIEIEISIVHSTNDNARLWVIILSDYLARYAQQLNNLCSIVRWWREVDTEYSFYIYLKTSQRQYCKDLTAVDFKRKLKIQLLIQSMHKKVLKGTKRMPWHILPTKDVEDCEKSRGAVNRLWSGNIRMGKPAAGHAVSIVCWIHRHSEREPSELKHLSRTRKRE